MNVHCQDLFPRLGLIPDLIEEAGEIQGIVFETTWRDVEKSILELIYKSNRHYVNMHGPHLIILIDVFVRISALNVGDT